VHIVDPEQRVVLVLADALGLALEVVLDTPPRAERLAFVLHDCLVCPSMTGPLSWSVRLRLLPDSSPAEPGAGCGAARRSWTPPARRVAVVDAFLAAAHGGDFDAFLAGLAPDVALRADGGAPLAATREVRGPTRTRRWPWCQLAASVPTASVPISPQAPRERSGLGGGPFLPPLQQTIACTAGTANNDCAKARRLDLLRDPVRRRRPPAWSGPISAIRRNGRFCCRAKPVVDGICVRGVEKDELTEIASAHPADIQPAPALTERIEF
jgi:hypothetical protein